jgi:hypothetical protein
MAGAGRPARGVALEAREFHSARGPNLAATSPETDTLNPVPREITLYLVARPSSAWEEKNCDFQKFFLV